MQSYFRNVLGLLLLSGTMAGATVIDLKANQSDGPLRVAEGDPIHLSVRLVPDGSLRSRRSDWWLAAQSGPTILFYTLAHGWTTTVTPVVQVEGVVLPATEVLQLPPLPLGQYSLYFAIDDDDDGLPSPVALDAVEIEVLARSQMPPVGGRLVQVSPGAALGSARLTWLPASDENTPADHMRYSVYVGEREDFSAGAETLKSVVVGSTEVEVAALQTGRGLYARVVATDADGNESRDNPTLGFQLPTRATEMASGFSVVSTASLGWTSATRQGLTVTTAKTGSTQVPSVGQVLSGTDTQGLPFVGTVKSVVVSDSAITVTLEGAAMTSLFASGALATSLRLDDLATVPATSSQTHDGVDDPVRRVRSGSVVITSGAPASPRRVRDISANAEVTLDTSLSFSPALSYDFQWSGGGLLSAPTMERADVVMIGAFAAETQFTFKFDGAAQFEREFDMSIPHLFPRRFQTRLFIGNLPVLVDVDLTLKARLNATATSAVETTAIAKYSRTLTMGMRYDPATGSWGTTAATEFDRTLTVDLRAQGGISGELRLIPNVQVTFNKVLSIGASVEPYLSAQAVMAAVAGRDLVQGTNIATTQPTQFDVALNAECRGYVNLELFVATIPLLSGSVCGPYTYPLFTLPTLDLKTVAGTTLGVGRQLPLTLTLTDGVQNPVSRRSIQFEVGPTPSARVVTTAVSSAKPGETVATATFVPCAPGTHVVYASAYGRLGELARQYSHAQITATDDGADRAPVLHSKPSVVKVGETVHLSLGSESLNCPATAYRWEVSDGRVFEGSSAALDLRFDAPGNYNITVTAPGNVTASAPQMQTSTSVMVVQDGCRVYKNLLWEDSPQLRRAPGIQCRRLAGKLLYVDTFPNARYGDRAASDQTTTLEVQSDIYDVSGLSESEIAVALSVDPYVRPQVLLHSSTQRRASIVDGTGTPVTQFEVGFHDSVALGGVALSPRQSSGTGMYWESGTGYFGLPFEHYRVSYRESVSAARTLQWEKQCGNGRETYFASWSGANEVGDSGAQDVVKRRCEDWRYGYGTLSDCPVCPSAPYAPESYGFRGAGFVPIAAECTGAGITLVCSYPGFEAAPQY